MVNESTFKPDWVSPPGDTISAILAERRFAREDFAKAVACICTNVDDLINGHVAITAELANLLEDVLGAPASFWLNREARYRADCEQLIKASSSPDALGWLKSIPAREMCTLGWIHVADTGSAVAAECLKFFGVPSVNRWTEHYTKTLPPIVFRTSKAYPSQPGAVAAWLRQGEIKASEIDCKPWDPTKFRKALDGIRALTREPDPAKFLPEVTNRCAACGLAVVVLQAPTECKASGAARFLRPNAPMVLLSGRHLSDDHFWFAFYHEAGHILLHSDKLLVVDGLGADGGLPGIEEDEANRFAQDLLIPPEHQAEMLHLRANKMMVMRFARKIGISRGIVVGQLQHRGIIPRDYLNGLKYPFCWFNK
jgi:Zn-dependent peptidase ImmA (M78 family)/plasmid maintenance system antidote protein VapI